MPSSSSIQSIFQCFKDELLQNQSLPIHKLKTLNDISNCRTGLFGATVKNCDNCGHSEILFHSCQNRHCPVCQASNQAQWCEDQIKHTLPIQYFHVVFTLPSELNSLVYSNQKLLYTLFFNAASQTILELCADHKYLNATPGLIGVLHTWGQNLQFHPHIHFIVTGGGLSNTGTSFVHSCKKFFIPVKVLSSKFKGKFLSLLKACFSDNDNKLLLTSECSKLKSAEQLKVFFDKLYSSTWVVYSKATFKSSDHVVRYLGRYTHRVAISNSRIISVDKIAKTVTFKWKDYKDGNKNKVMTLPAVEFLRRFLLHILPPHFRKIRYYGLLSNRSRLKLLSLCRKLLKVSDIPTPVSLNTTVNNCLCKVCHSLMRISTFSRQESLSLFTSATVP
jgi:hypothetical protein